MKNKILLGFGALVSSSLPIFSIVSCTNEDKKIDGNKVASEDKIASKRIDFTNIKAGTNSEDFKKKFDAITSLFMDNLGKKVKLTIVMNGKEKSREFKVPHNLKQVEISDDASEEEKNLKKELLEFLSEMKVQTSGGDSLEHPGPQ